MQVKGKHDRALHFTGYIGLSEVSRIQVDPGSLLSLISRWVMQHLGIPTHRLSATQTTIYGFNTNGQIGNLRSELTCYVIDADTLYNLLLGRPWIHRNSTVPSTLHQAMKYTDRDEKVRTLIAERHPFKGVENYFTDSLLYQDSVETDENPQPDDLESCNETDIEPKAEEECLWELNL